MANYNKRKNISHTKRDDLYSSSNFNQMNSSRKKASNYGGKENRATQISYSGTRYENDKKLKISYEKDSQTQNSSNKKFFFSLAIYFITFFIVTTMLMMGSVKISDFLDIKISKVVTKNDELSIIKDMSNNGSENISESNEDILISVVNDVIVKSQQSIEEINDANDWVDKSPSILKALSEVKSMGSATDEEKAKINNLQESIIFSGFQFTKDLSVNENTKSEIAKILIESKSLNGLLAPKQIKELKKMKNNNEKKD